MRIAHLLRKLDPAEWGGTETAVQRLVDGLRRQDIDSIVYCPRLPEPSAPEVLAPCPSADPLAGSACRVERFRAFVPVLGLSQERKRQFVAVGGNLMSFDLLGSLWREKNISVVHTHTAGRIGAIGRTVARRRRIPFVISIHGGVMDVPPLLKKSFAHPNHEGWEWGRLFGLLLRAHRVFHDADAIVTCNPREAGLWRERFPAKRVVVQPHGIPLECFGRDQRGAARAAFPQIFGEPGGLPANGDASRPGHPRSNGRQVLLCVGRIDPVKNQAWLLDQAPAILRKHPGALLVLVGPCTDAPYGELIRQKIRTLGLEDRVLLTGGLPGNDSRLVGLLQEAAALLLPSISETFGLVILEAWAAGTVVLSSRTSGPAALIRDGCNGWLFDLDRPQTFHEALDRTLARPARAREMAACGATLAAEHSLAATAARMKQLYTELVQRRDHRPAYVA